MVKMVHGRSIVGNGSLNSAPLDPFRLFELFDFSFHRGDLTCKLGALGVGACTAAAAIRGKRSGGSSSRQAGKLGLRLG